MAGHRYGRRRHSSTADFFSVLSKRSLCIVAFTFSGASTMTMTTRTGCGGGGGLSLSRSFFFVVVVVVIDIVRFIVGADTDIDTTAAMDTVRRRQRFTEHRGQDAENKIEFHRTVVALYVSTES